MVSDSDVSILLLLSLSPVYAARRFGPLACCWRWTWTCPTQTWGMDMDMEAVFCV